jgi:hypothetical protein
MLVSGRNQNGLSGREIEQCREIWRQLCGDEERDLVTMEASKHSSRTYFSEVDGLVHLGADVLPAKGVVAIANARMSPLACLAHELSHAERFERGYQRPFDLPDKLIDEAEASLHASFVSILSLKDREDLIEDAKDRLVQWLAEGRSESVP